MTRISVFCLAIITTLTISCSRNNSFNGKIVFINGTASLNGKNIQLNDSVTYGDIIETGEDGSCDIQIGEKTIFRIGKDTRLVYTISKDNNVLELQKGWLAGVTRKLFTKQGIYTVKTPTVVASVRGTSYCIKVENPKSTYFCVCNGTIALQGKGIKSSKDVTAAHHSAARFSLDKNNLLKINYKPGLLYHGDKTIEELMAKINETIDWEKPDTI